MGPVLDTRTGQLVSHGTLSQFRSPDQVLNAATTTKDFSLSILDNFLELIINHAEHVQDATDKTLSFIDLLLQSLSSLYGERFFYTLLSVEDANGIPQPLQTKHLQIQIFQATFYNIDELKERFIQATEWALAADKIVKKALFYFEHACLLNEFSQTLPAMSPHASFSRALAFLQLYKALTSIVGDPSSDKDYQSRCRKIGLAKDFWQLKVKPLYDVRNDEDVAHYSHSIPEPGAFHAKYFEAVTVFREAIGAYMSTNKNSS